MKFNNKLPNYIFNYIEIPEIFFVKYFKEAPADAVKVYMYINYEIRKQKEMTLIDIAEATSLSRKTVQDSISYWEGKGLIVKRLSGYELESMQEIELNSKYSPKVALSVDESLAGLKKINSNKDKEKEQLIKDINNNFFSGSMSTHWYTSILHWLEKYNFTEELMFAIFQYAFREGPKPAKYIETVSEAYFKEGIKTYSDYEKHILKQDEVKKLSKYIKKKLNLINNLTEPQERILKKWVTEFEIKKEILDYMFEISANKSDLGFNYYDKILTVWNNTGLKTKKQVIEYMENTKKEKSKEMDKTKEKDLKTNRINNREFLELEDILE